MEASGKLAGPLSSLFAGSEAARVMDFLLSKEQHQSKGEIHLGAGASAKTVNTIIDNLLSIEAVGIGARKVRDVKNNKSTDDNTYYIRDDSDTGKSIRDLWYHLMQVQSKSIS